MSPTHDHSREALPATGSPATGNRPPRSLLLEDASALIPYLRSRLAALDSLDMVEPALSTPEQLAAARSAAVLAPLYAVGGRPHLLFIKRAATLSSHRGEIAFPGGGHDPTDPSLLATALREAEEELALDPARVEVLGRLPRVFTVVSNYLVLPVVGSLGEGVPAVVPNPEEVAEVIEAPLAALADPAIFHEELWTRNGIQRPVRFYDLGRHRIWGMTAHVLYTLLALLPAAQNEASGDREGGS